MSIPIEIRHVDVSQWVDGGSNDESKIVAAPRLACYIWIYIRFVSDAFNQRHRIVEDIQYDYILMVNVTIAWLI